MHAWNTLAPAACRVHTFLALHQGIAVKSLPRSIAICTIALLLCACAGNDGTNGSDGASGTNSLVDVVAEAAGANCTYGGSRIATGPDSNRNGVLDTSEVTSTRYVCNGATNGNTGGNGVNTLVAIVIEAVGSNCANGGSKVITGPDTDDDGVLDSSEVTSTVYICNGNGGAGVGTGTLVAVVAEAVGHNCAYGGSKVTAGPDTDDDGVLDSSEVTSTSYICNGDTGASGTDTLVAVVAEAAGSNCANGGSKVTAGADGDRDGALDSSEVASTSYICNGSTGGDGVNTLVDVAPEPAGAQCLYGGSRITSGPDANRDGVLDSAEITVTRYVCDGSPGPGITWVDVTGSSVQALSNRGYLINSSDQVTIALPATPAVGDVVQISGIGAGGWIIAQNPGQTIQTGNLQGGAIASVWTPRDSNRAWSAVASSADGVRLVATENGGPIYTSTDSGATWTARATAQPWRYVASSADGTRLVATMQLAVFHSVDSGATWTQGNWTDPFTLIGPVASSADGVRLIAGQQTLSTGCICTSTDSGQIWFNNGTAGGSWSGLASSTDGTKLVGTTSAGRIYTSTDSGVNWTARDSNRNWAGVASSADGARLVAVTSGGQIYTSTDSGVTWTPRDSNRSWSSVASSADGTRLLAATSGGQIYTSTNSGVTWTPRDSNRAWRSVASSADGARLVAVADGGQIYTSTPTLMSTTSVGTAGSIGGRRYDAIDLQYVGNGLFMVRSSAGMFDVR